jgi:putative transposase
MKKSFSIKDFSAHIKECKDKKVFKKMKAMSLYRINKKSAKEVASIVYTSPGNIYQWAYKYKKYGIEGLLPKKMGGRRREKMTLSEEESLLREIADEGDKGLIVIAKGVQSKAEEKVPSGVFKAYAYSLLKRHGWRKVKPRQQNPKSSKEIRKKFRDDFSDSVQAVAKTFPKTDNRPLKVLFEDEGRFGRMTHPMFCWAPDGIRPIVPYQLVRQFLYVFSVVCPKTGANFSLILSDADTEMMNIFLAEVSNHFKDYRLIIVADQAAWHKSKTLQQFDNIRFLHLPPGSPELNPVEHLWDHAREKYFANRNFDSLDKMKDQLIIAFKEIYHDTKFIQSLVCFPWTRLSFTT